MAGEPRDTRDIKARLLAIFRVEAEEHLQVLTANLLSLDRGLAPAETREVVEATFRELHTLKGAARSVSLMDVEALCQACESVLSGITHDRLALTRPILSHLQEAVDRVARFLAGGGSPVEMRELIGRLDRAAEPSLGAAEPVGAPVPSVEPPAGPGAAARPPADTIRLATAKLDALLLQAEDLLAPKLVAGERVREVGALVDALARSRMVWQRARAAERARGAPGLSPGVPAELDSTLRALETQARETLGHLVRDQRAIAGAVDGLLEELRRTRMMPAATVLDLFPPMVRDLARAPGKQVEWVARGAELEVDRKVLQAIKDPLIHLVRNAVDHGIEPPEARGQAGKPLTGRVALTIAPLEGNRIEIRVEDDGGGIDPARVRAEAVRARLVTAEEAQALADEAVLELVYRPGFSTSPIITDVSGHGLGLAIVRDAVQRLGGQIHLQTRLGVGTAVRMVLPAAIATFRGLLVRTGGQRFLLPIDAAERAIRIAADQVESVEGRPAIRADGHLLPVARLDALLRLPEEERHREPGGKEPCAIVRVGEERLGVLVDEILGEREVLLKELRPPLARVRNVAGAGLLGTGQVVLILRPADLFRSVRDVARSPAPAAAPEGPGRPRVILVVDDSITTRTMEKNLLEAAGYQVRVAVDGVEAWTALKSEAFDLVVSDVDMPRMDGFELTARIRADRKLTDLPVVLVTALESREDKERGVEAGANAYLVKSSFDQSNLLEIIRRLT